MARYGDCTWLHSSGKAEVGRGKPAEATERRKKRKGRWERYGGREEKKNQGCE